MILRAQASSPGHGTRWRSIVGVLRLERSQAQILGGSIVMLIGSGLVSALNFGYNVAVARLLGPAAFGHAAAAVTLLMLVSAITLAFQLVCAKFIAKNETAGQKSAVYRSLRRRAWLAGVTLGSLLMLTSSTVAQYLNLPSPNLVIWLALGIAFYIPLGVKRGGLQGTCAFRRLTANFVLEAAVRFIGAIVLIELGLGVTGAICAIALSVVLAYFLPPTPTQLEVASEKELPASFREGMQAIVFFVGQVIINNIDILLVKHFFNSELAGWYAAVALVGRVLYFFSWSVVSAMFPITAGAKQQEENASVLLVPLGIVFFISVVFTLALGLFPDLVLRTIFGPGFHAHGRGLDSLLLMYAAATGLYAMSVVLMAYEMSRKLANTGWIQLVFSGSIVVGIGMFHGSLQQVIVVQIVLMAVLLVTSALPFLRFRMQALAAARRLQVLPPTASTHATTAAAMAEIPHRTMKRLRRVSEAEVVAEFLKNEFYHAEFQRDRDRFERWVTHPDTSNEAENALRKALLFRRRETMWRELPLDTEWWEVELAPQDLERFQVFPRAQWRKLASGNFSLVDIVQRIREGKVNKGTRTSSFVAKLMNLGRQLRAGDGESRPSTILLIGIDDWQPLTIIEGNHRVTAAALVSPELTVSRFRFVCGFSPNMTSCCWYQTNLTTLWRYARNRAKILLYDREAEIARLVGPGPNDSANASPIYVPAVKPEPSTDILRKEAS